MSSESFIILKNLEAGFERRGCCSIGFEFGMSSVLFCLGFCGTTVILVMSSSLSRSCPGSGRRGFKIGSDIRWEIPCLLCFSHIMEW